MTFEELDRSLPNGFHDATIRKLEIDYAARTVSLVMELLVGAEVSGQTHYRDGLVVLEGMEFVVVEPPVSWEFLHSPPLPFVDLLEAKSFPASAKSLRVPRGCFLAALYTHWSSCIYVVARNARHEWLGGDELESSRGLG